MITKPKLGPDQFAVIMADGATGHVLAIDRKVHLGDEKEAYLIFNSLEEVGHFIENLNKEDETIEVTVYDANYELLAYHNAPKWPGNSMQKKLG